MLPTNIADAVAQLRDGELGNWETIKIGDVVVSALMDVDYTDDSVITDRRVQAGYSATEAAVDLPDELGLTVCFANPDYSVEAGVEAALTGSVTQLLTTWREAKDEIYAYKADMTIVEVQTHEDLFTSMLIKSISPAYDVDENWDCWIGYIQLKELQGYATEDEYGIIDSPIEDVGAL